MQIIIKTDNDEYFVTLELDYKGKGNPLIFLEDPTCRKIQQMLKEIESLSCKLLSLSIIGMIK